MMEKQNVVEEKRTPDHELSRPDENWDKKAADKFIPVIKVEPAPAPKNIEATTGA